MVSPGEGVVARGELVEDLDIGRQGAARVARLDQVVAEDVILRKRLVGGRPEGVHVVETFAGEGSLAEQVHVGVRDGSAIGIDADRPGEQLREP